MAALRTGLVGVLVGALASTLFGAFLPLHTGSPGTFLTCNRNVNPGWLAGRCMTGTNLTVLPASAFTAAEARAFRRTYALLNR